MSIELYGETLGGGSETDTTITPPLSPFAKRPAHGRWSSAVPPPPPQTTTTTEAISFSAPRRTPRIPEREHRRAVHRSCRRNERDRLVAATRRHITDGGGVIEHTRNLFPPARTHLAVWAHEERRTWPARVGTAGPFHSITIYAPPHLVYLFLAFFSFFFSQPTDCARQSRRSPDVARASFDPHVSPSEKTHVRLSRRLARRLCTGECMVARWACWYTSY